MRGVDVSWHNGDVDWRELKNAGIDFAIVRTGYGCTGRDDYFQRNVDRAHAAGLICGAYHYSYAITDSDAAQEAIFCKQIIEDSGVFLSFWNCPCGLTWETRTATRNGTALILVGDT